MSNQRLNGWNPQKTVYTFDKDRKFETGLRKAALYADLGLAEATGGQFHGELIKINPDLFLDISIFISFRKTNHGHAPSSI